MSTKSSAAHPRRMDIKGVLKAVFSTLFIVANNVYCIPTYLLWMLTLRPIHWLNPVLYWQLEGRMFRWLLAMVSYWLWRIGYYISEMGDDIRECYNEECLLLVNHQSTGDVVTLMSSLQNKGATCARVYWIMDHIFLYTNFGWVSLCHGDFFLQQGKDYRDKQLDYLENHLRDVFRPRGRKWIILFPEGGFLRKRRENSQKYARKNNHPVLEHVTLPRLGAMETILKTLAPRQQHNHMSNGDTHKQVTENRRRLKWVIDVTIGYPDNRPLDAFRVLFADRESCTTTLYYRKYPIEEVPTDSEALTRWMYARYEEKEQILNGLYTTGKYQVNKSYHSPSSRDTVIDQPRRIELDSLKIWSLHILFLTSSYFHYCLLSSLWRLLVGCF